MREVLGWGCLLFGSGIFALLFTLSLVLLSRWSGGSCLLRGEHDSHALALKYGHTLDASIVFEVVSKAK